MLRKSIRTILGLSFLITIVSLSDESDTDGSDWRWMQSGVTFRPPVASVFEPRIGFTFFGDRNAIRLDIGSGIDFLSRPLLGGTLAVGGEFFTFTLLESWQNLHFPVIAIDYFFGANISYREVKGNDVLSSRFRFAHISAHFVDGHYDKETGSWRDGRNPIVYSRDFIELLGSYQRGGGLTHRWYGGFAYLFNVTPGWLGRFLVQGGYEVYFHCISQSVTPYAAYDARAVEIGGWHINHSVQTGIKLGHPFGRGPDLFFSYYNGYNVHGELFDQKIEYWGGGFVVHL
jgi:hypothetical protein